MGGAAANSKVSVVVSEKGIGAGGEETGNGGRGEMASSDSVSEIK